MEWFKFINTWDHCITSACNISRRHFTEFEALLLLEMTRINGLRRTIEFHHGCIYPLLGKNTSIIPAVVR